MSEQSIELMLKKSLDHFLNTECPSHLKEAIAYSLLSPGKRIRPRLFLATSQMLDLNVDHVLPAALALEMAHCFTLIHDDLPCMDDDDFRRGLPSNHKKFGEALALLAGDSLMALAFDSFLNSQVAPSHLLKGLKRFSYALGPRGVIGGQVRDSFFNKQCSLEDLKTIHLQKTGALFEASILVPKDFSFLNDEVASQSLIHFARELGIAFQYADDLEDYEEMNHVDSKESKASILHYLSAQETFQSIEKNLGKTSSHLTHHWKEKALPLQQLAKEVISKSFNALQVIEKNE